jgi:hypothetical protein
MASKDSMVRDLLDKLRDAPPQELSEVVDFVERLRAKRQASSKQESDSAALEARLAQAVAAGVLRAPEPNARRFSTIEAPPLQVSGRPASEIVLEDRR